VISLRHDSGYGAPPGPQPGPLTDGLTVCLPACLSARRPRGVPPPRDDPDAVYTHWLAEPQSDGNQGLRGHLGAHGWLHAPRPWRFPQGAPGLDRILQPWNRSPLLCRTDAQSGTTR
jgi:hypothetical protein